MRQKESDQITHEALTQPPVDPEVYLSTVIDLYRQGESDYRGRRTEEQKLIAEYASEEADEYFDGMLLGVLSLSSALNPSGRVPVLPEEDQQRSIMLGNIEDGESLYEMRNAWRQLWVGMNVITNRLRRDSESFEAQGLPELFHMSEDNKKLYKDTLFNSFQELNALRFGVKGSGLRRGKFIPDIDGGGEPIRVTFDPDKAKTDAGIGNNAARRKYRVKRGDSKKDQGPAMHVAGKMTPEEFMELRKEFPEVEMDRFAFDVAFSKNALEKYRSASNED